MVEVKQKKRQKQTLIRMLLLSCDEWCNTGYLKGEKSFPEGRDKGFPRIPNIYFYELYNIKG